jgi:PTS system sucrose-specific IIC component
MMGLVEALGKIPGLGFDGTDWYGFLDMVANTAFAYLPVIVAISAARVFGGNLFLGAVVGLLMIHSALTNGWNAADGYNVWYLFGHIKITDSYTLGQINQLGYQGHVIPVVISVWFMCQWEKWLHKHVPEMLDLFITPLCTVFVTALLTFTIIGPIFSSLETLVLAFATKIVANPIGAMVMGAVYPATVVMGLHHMYNVIEAGMLSVEGGLNTWMPIASAANFAQFGACLAVGLKARNNKTKVIAIPSSASAALGITEPAIFGVNMRFFKPFVCGMAGGAVGAFFGAITHIGAKAYGVTGIPGYLTIDKPFVYTILLAISGGIAFAATWVIWREDEPEKKAAPVVAEQPAQPQQPVITCEAGTVLAPVPGKVIAYTDIPDPTFAAGVLGTGVGVWPDDDVVRAPYDGEISSVAETQHAVGITGPGDMEVLIHIGVDTVAMNGDGFQALVKEGDTVKAGQPLVKFDRAKIKAANHPDVVVTLLTNSEDYNSVAYPGVVNA